MTEVQEIRDIRRRTGGEIFIGVVGPVRTGKSTFIKKFMDTVVIPNLPEGPQKDRAVDELPQSAAGRTIMTTEPKFIPEQAAVVQLSEDGQSTCSVRMIDCVGYIVPSAIGYIEEDQPRMVRTPWFEEPIPFNMAAEIGTKKVITEHSTIGLVVTTDGSISDIPRQEYEEAEERVIAELEECGKPYVVLLNCVDPSSQEAGALAEQLRQKYGVPVLAVNCMDIREQDVKAVLSGLLVQFPLGEIALDIPGWVANLEGGHWLLESLLGSVKEASQGLCRMGDLQTFMDRVGENPYIKAMGPTQADLGSGRGQTELMLDPDLFFQVLSEKTELDIRGESDLMTQLMEMTEIRRRFSKLQQAYDDVLETGYGIVMPEVEELALEEPKILRQNGKYGIRLKATAPAIHMMRTTIQTEITPIVGSEQQSEELVLYLLREFEENPVQIWESNIFGKSLHSLVSEGMHNKLTRMPDEARDKVRETIERIINDGCSGLLCIIL